MFLALVLWGGLSVLLSITIARHLGVTDFGVYSIIVGLQSMFGIAAGFGLGTAVAKFLAEYRRRDPSVIGRYAKTALVLAMITSSASIIIYISLSNIIGVGLYGEPEIVDLIPFSSLVVVTTAFYSLAFGMIQGCQRIRMMAAVQVAVPIVNLALIIPLMILLGTRGVFISYFVAQGLVFLVGFFSIETRMLHCVKEPIRIWGDDVAKKIINFALPGMIAGLLVSPVYWIGSTQLVLVEGFSAMGLFAAAFVFFNALSMIPQAVVIPLMPRVSELSVANMEQVDLTVSRALRFVALFTFPIFFGIALFDRQIITFLYGNAYSQASAAMYLLVVASYFSATLAMIGSMFTGLGRMWLALALNLVWALSFIILTVALLPWMGLVGLGASYALSYVLFAAVVFLVARGVLKHNIGSAIPSVVVAGVLFLVGFFVREQLSQSSSYLYSAPVLLVAGILAMLYIMRSDIERARGYVRSILQK